MRAVEGGRPVDWVVMRNRLSSLAARNKRDMGNVIEALAKRIGFRVAAGLSERVIYKELFLSGLTLLDLKRGSGGGGPSLTLSHVAARQEVRDLVAALNLPRRSLLQKWTRPRQKKPRQSRHLQDEEQAERPGVAVGRIAGGGARPQVDDLADRPLAGEDHGEDHEIAAGADPAGILRREGTREQRHVLDRIGAEEAEQQPGQRPGRTTAGRRARRRPARTGR